MNQRPRTEIRQTQRLALSLGLAASIKVLRHDALGLTLYLEEQAAANPWLRLERTAPPAGEWLPRWSATLARLRGAEADAAPSGAAGPSLIAHVLIWIDHHIPPRLRTGAHIFAEALEPSGWLGRPLPDLAADAHLTLPAAEALLRLLQGIEPSGLFARSLAECLDLQCREAGLMDAVMAVVLARLDLLAAGDHARLARLAGVPERAQRVQTEQEVIVSDDCPREAVAEAGREARGRLVRVNLGHHPHSGAGENAPAAAVEHHLIESRHAGRGGIEAALWRGIPRALAV